MAQNYTILHKSDSTDEEETLSFLVVEFPPRLQGTWFYFSSQWHYLVLPLPWIYLKAKLFFWLNNTCLIEGMTIACRGTRATQPFSPLYELPLPNCYHKGLVCLSGDTRSQIHDCSPDAMVAQLWQQLWGTGFIYFDSIGSSHLNLYARANAGHPSYFLVEDPWRWWENLSVEQACSLPWGKHKIYTLKSLKKAESD